MTPRTLTDDGSSLAVQFDEDTYDWPTSRLTCKAETSAWPRTSRTGRLAVTTLGGSCS